MIRRLQSKITLLPHTSCALPCFSTTVHHRSLFLAQQPSSSQYSDFSHGSNASDVEESLISEYLKKHTESDNYDVINKLTTMVSKFPGERQEILLDAHKENAIAANIKLHLLLNNISPHTYQNIFTHVVSAPVNFQSELLEVFLYNLLQAGNIAATTSLLHVLLDKNEKLRLSNEFWSTYISKVCESANHLGAILIYHHLVDHYELYSEKNLSSLVPDNHNYQFLLSPAILKELGIIFQHNKDPLRSQGLLQYFKKFYSYSGHKNTFKSLKISVVEAYSASDDVVNALVSFRDLAMSFRGHANPRDWEKAHGSSKMAAYTNYLWRRDNIMNNTNNVAEMAPDLITALDLEQEKLCKENEGFLYNPTFERNVYSGPKIPHIPLLNGSLSVCDLPYFYQLIKKGVIDIMDSENKDVMILIPTIQSSHFMLHSFIVQALCELGHLREAFSILLKMPTSFRNCNIRIVIREEDFCCIFKEARASIISSRSSVSSTQMKDLEDTARFLNRVINFYNGIQINNSGSLSNTVYSYFISSLVESPLTTADDLRLHLDKLTSNNSPSVSLDEDAFSSFHKICQHAPALASRYSSIVHKIEEA
ncbi:uncharacterized protein RJT20DRAFT_98932 [Scheffersomyces xylosifermentans]|uniref:uncharacterized protein n=1 Tax=Scheffersomyces xylosifermentans TaxID=1304137 RepID=UPI00315C960C